MPYYSLTSVSVSGSTTTYNGTITGGGSNAYAGLYFTVSGFLTNGNNVPFLCTASTGSTLVCTTSTQVNETDPATATQDGNTFSGAPIPSPMNRPTYAGLILGNLPPPPSGSGGGMVIRF
jgi:hypothetical protein